MGHWQQCQIRDLEIVHKNSRCNRSRIREGDTVIFTGIPGRSSSGFLYDVTFIPCSIPGTVATVFSGVATVRFGADVGGWGGSQSIEEYMLNTYGSGLVDWRAEWDDTNTV